MPIASLHDAFNGPRHDRDPVARGLIASDAIHPADKGKALILRTLEALGYAPLQR